MTYSWSRNEESFTGDFETREAALADAQENNPERSVFWTGENHKKSAIDFVDVGNLFEDMQMAADDVAGEASEDWLPSWRVQTEKQNELAEIIAKFVDENWPAKFFSVDEIQKHEVEPKEPAHV
jgi:hypothetical protein